MWKTRRRANQPAVSKPKKGANKPKGKSNKPKPKPAPPAAEAVSTGEGGRKLTREERWEQARRAKRRQSLIRRTVVGVVIAALVGGVLAWQVGKRRNENRAIAAMTKGSCEFDRKSDEGGVNEHAPNVRFTVEPPSGGVHTQQVAGPGNYLERTPPPDGQLVHALEHGDIAIWVRPDVPEQDRQVLLELADQHETDVLLISRPQLPVPVAATAWHKRLLCQNVERDALRRFIERWHDKGPEGQKD